MGSRPSKGTPAATAKQAETATRSHEPEKEVDEAAEEHDTSDDDDDDVISIDEKDLQRKDKIIQRIEDVIKTMSRYKEHHSDETGMSKEYRQVALLLLQLHEALAGLSDDERAKTKFQKEEGNRVANCGGIETLCDIVVFLFQKCNDFQDMSVEDESKFTNWDVAEKVNSYLINYSDANPRHTKLIVSHRSYIKHSAQVIGKIWKKHSGDNELVSQLL